MKNQPTSAMIAGIMSGVAAACVCLTIVLALQSRSLQRQLADAQRLGSEASAYAADLRVQQASTVADLASHRQRLAEAQQEVAALEAKVSNTMTVTSRPVPVRIFDNNRLVGVGWIPASATNRSGLAGEGVATVFLDRRTSATPTSEESAAAQTAPTSRGAAAASSAFVVQQSPYYGWFWPYGSWDCGLEPDGEPTTDPEPQPPQPPVPPTPGSPPASPTLPQTVVARMAPSRHPTFSATPNPPTPLVSRVSTAGPIQPRLPSPVVGRSRIFTPNAGHRASPTFLRQPVPSTPLRR